MDLGQGEGEAVSLGFFEKRKKKTNVRAGGTVHLAVLFYGRVAHMHQHMCIVVQSCYVVAACVTRSVECSQSVPRGVGETLHGCFTH